VVVGGMLVGWTLFVEVEARGRPRRKEPKMVERDGGDSLPT
jgi:hypothetical protein